MTYLLDTNVCVRILTNSHLKVSQKYSALGSAKVAICSVVKAELYYGAYKSQRRSTNLVSVTQFWAPLVSLPFDDMAADVYGQIRAQLELQGTPIGPYDLLIAAQALRSGTILVTANVSEFARVPGLSWQDWTVTA